MRTVWMKEWPEAEAEAESLVSRLVTLFDDVQYAQLALKCKESFKNADPYPHVVLDNFLPTDIAEALAASYPDPDDSSVRW
jgi:hypothetical protein